jgi:putative membrane protein
LASRISFGYGASVVIAPLLSGLHVLALGVGLGSVFMRGRFLRSLRAGPDPRALDGLFAADTLWGVAAGLWLVTGLARAFGHVEKAPDFYLRNGFFWMKMTLFVAVVTLEIWPMLTFIRWRSARRSGRPLPQFNRLARLVLVDDVETALVVVIPFVAAAMARGLWLY